MTPAGPRLPKLIRRSGVSAPCRGPLPLVSESADLLGSRLRCAFQVHDYTSHRSGGMGRRAAFSAPCTSHGWETGPSDEHSVGDEPPAELTSRITEHTRYPSRLGTRSHWCPPRSSTPAQPVPAPPGRRPHPPWRA